MKRLLRKIANSFKILYMVWKYPSLSNVETWELSTSFFEFVRKVQEENRPYFSQFGIVHPDDGNVPIVTIWAAPGAGSTLEKRIKELNEENTA